MEQPPRKKKQWRKWLRLGFVVWAVFAMGYMWSTFQTKDVDPKLLVGNAFVAVGDSELALEFLPSDGAEEGLLFFCGSGVEAAAYAPLLRPVADAGYPVIIVNLPGRFAMGEGQKVEALERGKALIEAHPEVKHWLVGGHSLGGALSCRFIQKFPDMASALVLVGTTHPKEDDLSKLNIPVAKVYGSADGVAPAAKVEANKHLLPGDTEFVLIEGANHSQFGNYGNQLQDGKATIDRVHQQDQVRGVIISLLRKLAD